MPPDHLYFDERRDSREIFSACAGEVVALKLGDASVIVHRITSIGASRYRGTIVGFEKASSEACSVGDEIEFTERQVFSCTNGVNARPSLVRSYMRSTDPAKRAA